MRKILLIAEMFPDYDPSNWDQKIANLLSCKFQVLFKCCYIKCKFNVFIDLKIVTVFVNMCSGCKIQMQEIKPFTMFKILFIYTLLYISNVDIRYL